MINRHMKRMYFGKSLIIKTHAHVCETSVELHCFDKSKIYFWNRGLSYISEIFLVQCCPHWQTWRLVFDRNQHKYPYDNEWSFQPSCCSGRLERLEEKAMMLIHSITSVRLTIAKNVAITTGPALLRSPHRPRSFVLNLFFIICEGDIN